MFIRRNLTLLFVLLGLSLLAQEISIDLDRSSGSYKLGETAIFSINTFDAQGQPLKEGKLKALLSNDGGKVLSELTFDLAETPVPRITGSLPQPGFLRLTVPGYKNRKNRVGCSGAAFAAEDIKPGSDMPADFAAFWQQEIQAAEEIPLDAKISPMPAYSKEGSHRAYAVSFAAPGGRVYGFLTVPESDQPLPALVNVPGAGPGSSAPGIGLFANQAVFLSINVHNYDPLEPGSTAAEQYKELNKNGTYSHHGSNDKRKYYFHRAILGVNRAINYLSQRPEVDSQRIGIYGSSQGGMFALIMSSINPHIKAAVANVPAGCDHHGFLLERSPGWPRLVKANIPESSETAKYYDVVNFCRSLKVPVRVIVGFADTTCSPSSVYAAYNQILSKDKQIINEIDMAHSVKPSYAQQNDWLLAYLQDLK